MGTLLKSHISSLYGGTMQLSLLLFFFLSFLLLVSGQAPPVTPSAACKDTLYPKLCRSILSTFRSSKLRPDAYGQFSVKQCLKQARKMSGLIGHILGDNRRWPISHAVAGALDDCRQLAELNVDYLQTISGELKSAEMMTDELVERVRTLLSGIVTNQQTCYDGLVYSGNSMVKTLLAPLSNATQLYSVSLGLVSRALSRTRKRHKKRGLTELDRVPEPSSKIIEVINNNTTTNVTLLILILILIFNISSLSYFFVRNIVKIRIKIAMIESRELKGLPTQSPLMGFPRQSLNIIFIASSLKLPEFKFLNINFNDLKIKLGL